MEFASGAVPALVGIDAPLVVYGVDDMSPIRRSIRTVGWWWWPWAAPATSTSSSESQDGGLESGTRECTADVDADGSGALTPRHLVLVRVRSPSTLHAKERFEHRFPGQFDGAVRYRVSVYEEGVGERHDPRYQHEYPERYIDDL